MIKMVEYFVRFCEDELYDIELCAECYERKCMGIENVITNVCAVPHVVVWAKLEGYPYWPAKVVAINKRKVEVIFFGQHDTASIPYTRCRLFSQQSPNTELESNYEREFHDSYTVSTIASIDCSQRALMHSMWFMFRKRFSTSRMWRTNLAPMMSLHCRLSSL